MEACFRAPQIIARTLARSRARWSRHSSNSLLPRRVQLFHEKELATANASARIYDVRSRLNYTPRKPVLSGRSGDEADVVGRSGGAATGRSHCVASEASSWK